MASRNFRNRLPWRGFVKKSTNISPVGQYSTQTSFDLMRSVTKKYLMLMRRSGRSFFSETLNSWVLLTSLHVTACCSFLVPPPSCRVTVVFLIGLPLSRLLQRREDLASLNIGSLHSVLMSHVVHCDPLVVPFCCIFRWFFVSGEGHDDQCSTPSVMINDCSCLLRLFRHFLLLLSLLW